MAADILHSKIPEDLVANAPLPGIRPLEGGNWLRVDEAYAEQMAYRRHLLKSIRDKVLWQDEAAEEAIAELYAAVLDLLPALGYRLSSNEIECPDNVTVDHGSDTRLGILGRVLQQDLCILQKVGSEHVLTAAVLCFPASWTLSEKAGHPLVAIHDPVDSYDTPMATRVQRLFDGVQPGRPLWRNNMLRYEKPDLYQPLSIQDPARRQPAPERTNYVRAERQSIVRLPQTKAVLFAIHTYVVRASGNGLP